MTDNALYIASAGVVPFNEPIHPGLLPVHDGHTSAQITMANHQYDADLTKYKTCKIITAVSAIYLPLEDPNFGYSDITLGKMLQHLSMMYVP